MVLVVVALASALLVGVAVGTSLAWRLLKASVKKELDRTKAAILIAALSQSPRPRCVRCGQEHVITQAENSLTREFCNRCIRVMDFSQIYSQT